MAVAGSDLDFVAVGSFDAVDDFVRCEALVLRVREEEVDRETVPVTDDEASAVEVSVGNRVKVGGTGRLAVRLRRFEIDAVWSAEGVAVMFRDGDPDILRVIVGGRL